MEKQFANEIIVRNEDGDANPIFNVDYRYEGNGNWLRIFYGGDKEPQDIYPIHSILKISAYVEKDEDEE